MNPGGACVVSTCWNGLLDGIDAEIDEKVLGYGC